MAYQKASQKSPKPPGVRRRSKSFFSFSDALLQTWQAVSDVSASVVKWIEDQPPPTTFLPPPPPPSEQDLTAARQFRPQKPLRSMQDVTDRVRPRRLVTCDFTSGDADDENPNVFFTESLDEMRPLSPLRRNGSSHFPWENLVFEGGGNKGMAYVGALRALEDYGVIDNIQRVAGSSAGAICATLVAVGMNSAELAKVLDSDLKKILNDGSDGWQTCFCKLPSLFKNYGMNDGKKLVEWFGHALERVTGDPDITFLGIYRRYRRELCIVSTNLSYMSVEYFHVKTSPTMPVRWAVRMSMAYPVLFQSVRDISNGEENYYVDGGLLCNYPIHSFDGWWLSMKPEDAFVRRLNKIRDLTKLVAKKERFGKKNEKTLGIMLYSRMETEVMAILLKNRVNYDRPKPPKTALYRSREKFISFQEQDETLNARLIDALENFTTVLSANKLDKSDAINRELLERSFKDSKVFTREDAQMLFGCDSMSEALCVMDVDHDGWVSFPELVGYIRHRGVSLHSLFLSYTKKPINSLQQYIATTYEALQVNVKQAFVDESDVDRTIGIDTDYVETSDFQLELEDKVFLLQTGYKATEAYLAHYLQQIGQEPNLLSVIDDQPRKQHLKDDGGVREKIRRRVSTKRPAGTQRHSPGKETLLTGSRPLASDADDRSSPGLKVVHIDLPYFLNGPQKDDEIIE